MRLTTNIQSSELRLQQWLWESLSTAFRIHRPTRCVCGAQGSQLDRLCVGAKRVPVCADVTHVIGSFCSINKRDFLEAIASLPPAG